MKYTIVFTHNPQDFFEGIEPEDLTVYRPAPLWGGAVKL